MPSDQDVGERSDVVEKVIGQLVQAINRLIEVHTLIDVVRLDDDRGLLQSRVLRRQRENIIHRPGMKRELADKFPKQGALPMLMENSLSAVTLLVAQHPRLVQIDAKRQDARKNEVGPSPRELEYGNSSGHDQIIQNPWACNPR